MSQRNSDNRGEEGYCLFRYYQYNNQNVGIWKGWNKDSINEAIVVGSNDSEIIGVRDGEKGRTNNSINDRGKNLNTDEAIILKPIREKKEVNDVEDVWTNNGKIVGTRKG